MTKGTFEALVQFPNHVLPISAELVGYEVPFEYGDHKLKVCFPGHDAIAIGSGGSIKPIIPKFDPPVFDNRLDWGERHDISNYFLRHLSSNTSGLVSFTCNQFIVKSEQTVTPKDAETILRSLPEWQDLLISWIEVCKCVDLEFSNSKVQSSRFPESYFISGDGVKHIKYTQSTKLTITLPPLILSKEEFHIVLKKTETAEYPAPYFVALINAKRFHNQGNYRQSIIETAIACELGLMKMLEDKLIEEGVSEISRGLITRKYRQIRALLDALEALGINTIDSARISKDINTVRIEVLHEGNVGDEGKARSALKVCESLIYSKFPI